MHHGSCICRAITFSYDGDLSAPSICHCRECRKHSGFLEASTDVAQSGLTIHDETHLGWYQSSEKVRRGFCKTCGSTLFWDPVFHDWTAIAMGAFDTPTGVKVKGHIFTAEKGDHYDINDGLPQSKN